MHCGLIRAISFESRVFSICGLIYQNPNSVSEFPAAFHRYRQYAPYEKYLLIDHAHIRVAVVVEPGPLITLGLWNFKIMLRSGVCNIHRYFIMYRITNTALPS